MTNLAQFASRGIAVVIIAIVLAFFGVRFQAYLESVHFESYGAALAVLTSGGLGFVRLVEALARGVRAVGPSSKRDAVAAPAPPPQAPVPKVESKPEPPRPKPPSRSDAITLLAALQREARLID